MPSNTNAAASSLQGKRRKTWYGRYRTCHRDPDTGASIIRQHTKRIGPKSELTKFEAEERLRDVIAAETSFAPLAPDRYRPEAAHAWRGSSRTATCR